MTAALHNPRFPDHLSTPGGDRRNVIDFYKNWDVHAIRDDLAAKAFPLVVLAESLAGDFNIGTVARNANAFGAAKFITSGTKKWNRRGAVGVLHYTAYEHHEDPTALLQQMRADGWQVVVADNVEGAVPLADHVWAERTVLVFGAEQIGVSNMTLALADVAVEVPMWGSVRSLNVGTASGIVLHDYAARVSAARAGAQQ